MVWALAYRLVDLVPVGDGFYFAFVNYTTLGYGDILPAAGLAPARADHRA